MKMNECIQESFFTKGAFYCADKTLYSSGSALCDGSMVIANTPQEAESKLFGHRKEYKGYLIVMDRATFIPRSELETIKKRSGHVYCIAVYDDTGEIVSESAPVSRRSAINEWLDTLSSKGRTCKAYCFSSINNFVWCQRIPSKYKECLMSELEPDDVFIIDKLHNGKEAVPVSSAVNGKQLNVGSFRKVTLKRLLLDGSAENLRSFTPGAFAYSSMDIIPIEEMATMSTFELAAKYPRITLLIQTGAESFVLSEYSTESMPLATISRAMFDCLDNSCYRRPVFLSPAYVLEGQENLVGDGMGIYNADVAATCTDPIAVALSLSYKGNRLLTIPLTAPEDVEQTSAEILEKLEDELLVPQRSDTIFISASYEMARSYSQSHLRIGVSYAYKNKEYFTIIRPTCALMLTAAVMKLQSENASNIRLYPENRTVMDSKSISDILDPYIENASYLVSANAYPNVIAFLEYYRHDCYKSCLETITGRTPGFREICGGMAIFLSNAGKSRCRVLVDSAVKPVWRNGHLDCDGIGEITDIDAAAIAKGRSEFMAMPLACRIQAFTAYLCYVTTMSGWNDNVDIEELKKKQSKGIIASGYLRLLLDEITGYCKLIYGDRTAEINSEKARQLSLKVNDAVENDILNRMPG